MEGEGAKALVTSSEMERRLEASSGRPTSDYVREELRRN